MNYISEIAKMLNVEIGEEFHIVNHDDYDYGVFKLGENCLEHRLENGRWVNFYDHLFGAIICGRLKVVKQNESILTEKEREYLAAVIEPYRDDVVCIMKSNVFEYPRVYIHLKHETFGLPWFNKDEKYKGMELNKGYTLEELGL